jgi:hypothetical protein
MTIPADFESHQGSDCCTPTMFFASACCQILQDLTVPLNGNSQAPSQIQAAVSLISRHESRPEAALYRRCQRL